MPRLLLLLLAANTLFGGIRLALSLKALALGADAWQVGLVIGAIMLVPAVASPAIGRWADGGGGRMPAAAGAAILAGGALLALSSTSIWGLAGASVLVGSGYIVVSICTNNAIGAEAPVERRTQVFGWVATAFSAGAMLGPAWCGHAVDRVGLDTALGLAAAAAVACGAARLAMQETPRTPRGPTFGASHVGLLVDRRLRAVWLVNVASSLTWDLFVFLFPLIGSSAGLTASEIGTVIAVFAAAGLCARLLLPALPRRAGDWAMLRVSVLVSAVGYAGLAFTGGFMGYAVLGALIGLAAGLGLPLVLALVYASSPPGRTGEALGVRAATTCLGQLLMPMLFGALGTAAGYGTVLALGSIAMGLGALVRPAAGPHSPT